MLTKPSEASYWSQFAATDADDGTHANRHRLIDAWTRAGRLAEPPRHEDYTRSREV